MALCLCGSCEKGGKDERASKSVKKERGRGEGESLAQSFENRRVPRVKRRGGLFPFDVGASGVENDASGGDDDASGSNGGGDTHALLKRTRARRRREVGKDPCLTTRMILLATGNAYKTTFVQVCCALGLGLGLIRTHANSQTYTSTHPHLRLTQ